MSVNIEQLKAKLAAVQEANTKAIQEAAVVATLQAQLALETSPTLLAAKAQLAFSGEQTAKLERLVKECEAIISSVPVHNAKTRDNRKWNGTHRYTFGNQIDLMYQLASGITYSCQEHKQLLLAHTGLNLELLGQVLKAFGTPTYYSRNSHAVIEAKPYDLDMVKSTIQVMQSELGVTVDTSALTEENFQYEFERAENNATQALMQANEAIAEADFAL